mmetsp:Transcript_68421/g.160977  ORF Transcript_68421/g.160977 Transcript_68421/m.160977 type:complete len:211 (-) Transcript_68421:1174-1806(-)
MISQRGLHIEAVLSECNSHRRHVHTLHNLVKKLSDDVGLVSKVVFEDVNHHFMSFPRRWSLAFRLLRHGPRRPCRRAPGADGIPEALGDLFRLMNAAEHRRQIHGTRLRPHSRHDLCKRALQPLPLDGLEHLRVVCRDFAILQQHQELLLQARKHFGLQLAREAARQVRLELKEPLLRHCGRSGAVLLLGVPHGLELDKKVVLELVHLLF